MRCLKCGANIDELNESQPVCVACGTQPRAGVGFIELYADDEVLSAKMPQDLQEALDDAEALLLGTGQVMFDTPKGYRLFKLPTQLPM